MDKPRWNDETAGQMDGEAGWLYLEQEDLTPPLESGYTTLHSPNLLVDKGQYFSNKVAIFKMTDLLGKPSFLSNSVINERCLVQYMLK